MEEITLKKILVKFELEGSLLRRDPLKRAQENRNSDLISALEADTNNGDTLRKRLMPYAFRLMGGNFHDAEDLYQDTYLKIMTYADTYRYDVEPALGIEDKRFYRWVSRIMRNTARDIYRRRKHRIPTESELSTDPEVHPFQDLYLRPHKGTIFDRTIDNIFETELSKVIERGRYQEFRLHLAGNTYAEIAMVMGIPIGTVKSRIHKQRSRIQRYIPSDTD